MNFVKATGIYGDIHCRNQIAAKLEVTNQTNFEVRQQASRTTHDKLRKLITMRLAINWYLYELRNDKTQD